MNKVLIFGAVLSAVNLLGCADFDPSSRVVSFRVLAQQTDLPFARPGETVNISSLSIDPEGRSVDWAWAACVNPASSTVQGCLDEIARSAAESGASPILAQGVEMSSFDYTVPADALRTVSAAAKPSAFVGVVSIACPGDLSLAAPGPNHLPFACKERGTGRTFEVDEYIVGMKRIQVRAADRNHNPVIEKVTFDGADWAETEVKIVTACDTTKNDYKPCASSTKHTIVARPSAESVEFGSSEFGVGFTEQVIIEYYATEGIFEHDIAIAVKPETGWAARKGASGKDLTLWMVLHDDRGGTTWTERHVHVE